MLLYAARGWHLALLREARRQLHDRCHAGDFQPRIGSRSRLSCQRAMLSYLTEEHS